VNSRRSLTILFVIVFIDLLGFGMVIPVMPLYAKKLGASEAWIGLLNTGYSAMQFVFAPIWGRLSDRIGRKPVLLLSIAMTAVAFAVYGAAQSFGLLLASRLFAGAATANIAIAQAYVADVTPPEGRAKGMGLLGAAFGFGFVFGPAIGGVLSQHSLGLPGYAAAALAALNGAAAFFVLPEPAQHAAPARPRGRVTWLLTELQRPGIRGLLVCYFFIVLAFSAMEATFSLLVVDRYGLPIQRVNYLFAYIGSVIVLVQGGLIGPLTRRLGERRLLVAGAVLQALGLAGLPFAAALGDASVLGLPVGLLLAAGALAMGNGFTNPAISALISRRSRAQDQGGSLGIGQSAAAFGRILGPESGTFTYSRLAPHFPYVAGAGIMTLAAVIGSTLRQAPPEA
jgi:MFS family permease